MISFNSARNVPVNSVKQTYKLNTDCGYTKTIRNGRKKSTSDYAEEIYDKTSPEFKEMIKRVNYSWYRFQKLDDLDEKDLQIVIHNRAKIDTDKSVKDFWLTMERFYRKYLMAEL